MDLAEEIADTLTYNFDAPKDLKHDTFVYAVKQGKISYKLSLPISGRTRLLIAPYNSLFYLYHIAYKYVPILMSVYLGYISERWSFLWAIPMSYFFSVTAMSYQKGTLITIGTIATFIIFFDIQPVGFLFFVAISFWAAYWRPKAAKAVDNFLKRQALESDTFYQVLVDNESIGIKFLQ